MLSELFVCSHLYYEVKILFRTFFWGRNEELQQLADPTEEIEEKFSKIVEITGKYSAKLPQRK